MTKKLLSLLFICSTVLAFAQQRPGSIRGKVTDATTGEPVSFATVVVKDRADNVIRSQDADLDGNFNINPLDVGSYKIEISFMGYSKQVMDGVQINPNVATVQNFKLSQSADDLDVIDFIEFDKPLINTDPVTRVTDKEIGEMAVREITNIAAQTAGVYAADDGSAPIIRGSRSNTTIYFIDGVKVRGSLQLPQAAIQQTEVYTGGLPAQYGDATGGVISTTTKGPSPLFFGSAEVLSSSPFDDYHYNLGAFTIGGPLLKKKGTNKPIVGFLFAGEYQFENDPRPGSPQFRVNPGVLDDIRANPVRAAGPGQGVISNANFVTMNELDEISARLNVQRQDIRLSGNVNIALTETTNLSLGGRFVYSDGSSFNRFHSLFNYNNFAEFQNMDWAGFARLTQRFNSDGENRNSLLQNVFVSLQVDYTRNTRVIQDPNHRDNVFAYGHVGTFDLESDFAYQFGRDESTGLTGFRAVSPRPISTSFTPSPYNPELAAYTSFLYDAVAANPLLGSTRNFDDIRAGNGLINGDQPLPVYGLWGNVGANVSNYQEINNSQFRITGSTTFDIKDHSLIFGFEYEQRFDRSFSVGGPGLWPLMRLLQNDHINEFDFDNPMPVFDENGVFQDTILYPFLFSETAYQQNAFARRFRDAVGIERRSTEHINIDGYDPSVFSLAMFSPDQLINLSGARQINYQGYDHTGRIMRGSNPTIEDFFTQRNEDGTLARPVGAFSPIYGSVFLQDQFTFNDLRFNVGVRVDRYDANQSVLSDPFSLYPARTVGDLSPELRSTVPSSIGDDFIVYVQDYTFFQTGQDATIVGFRDEGSWFGTDGRILRNPKDIADAGGGQARPFFFDDPDNLSLGAESFSDYTPQIIVMPRINFNFPISDEALFFAHYDVLAQRPDPGLSLFNPIQILEYEVLKGTNSPIPNPNLLPQRTTDYEIGFTQVLTRISSMKISGFYREMRDMMQTRAMTNAYPGTYITYDNLDFSTVKGFSLEYDLRRYKNFTVFANYTLQFADGTGSGPNTSLNLARTEQPNLRFILPLSFDSRHQATVRFDYRYGSGKAYNGPVWGNKRVLENFGVNFVVNANSGTPFTRRELPYPLTTDPQGNIPTLGQINGSRLPWQFRADMRINKVFQFAFKEDGKKQNVDVYLQVLNVFNNLNVLNVYQYTGDPQDDGYLASDRSASIVAQAVSSEAFADLYRTRLQNPFNFSLPRRIRLGVMWNF
jgi:outer membrane receptor protein involved in Fe transport